MKYFIFSLMLVYIYNLRGIVSKTTVSAETTFYGSRDNCPPGGDIAYPQIHKEAGGNGTYHDPITYAGSKRATKAGTIIYVEFIKKYFIMEDDCQECDEDWTRNQKWHFDLWMGPDWLTNGSALITCEDAMTQSKTTVIVDPDSNLAVDPKPLFDGPTEKCWLPNPEPCTTKHPNQCGNECEIPTSATCAQLAQELLLTMTRFEQLNSNLDCSNGKVIRAGTTVCMGGPCGD